jgi:hypothetical protein
MQQKYQIVSGTGTANNATPTVALIAAQGAGKVIRITAYIITVTTAATGGSGIVSFKDGTTTLMSWDANALMNSQVNLGEGIGYPISANSAFNLVAENAGGNQATVNGSCVGYVVQ